jgi:hypothetical protein
MVQTHLAPSADSDRSFLRSLGWASPRLIDAALAAVPPASLPAEPAQRRRWLLYALLGQAADSHTLDDLAWANDERAEAYLDAMLGDNLPADLAELGCWLKYLPENRAKKHEHRRRLLELHGKELCRPGYPSPEVEAERADELARVRCLTTEREWDLLTRTAVAGLNAVADAEGLPVGTLKSQLHRCRERLRLAC